MAETLSFLPCCKGEWIIKTAVGGAWNAVAHTGGGTVFAVFGALINGTPINSIIGGVAKGTVVFSGITGVLRSGAGQHFLQNGITSEAHLAVETAVSLLTTFIGGAPVANGLFGSNVSLGDTGYPALILAGITYAGIGLKLAHKAGFFDSCPSLSSLPECCKSLPSLPKCCNFLPKFSIFSGSGDKAPPAEQGGDISAKLRKMDLDEKYREVMGNKL